MIGDLGNTDSDKQLFSAIIEGDRNAFECLFQKYYTILCDYSWTYLDGKGEAEDAVQEVAIEYQVSGVPYCIVLDPEGKIVCGGVRGAELDVVVQDLLGVKGL